MMPVTPVAARTRSRRSVDAPPARSRIPTRTTRRNPLGASTTVAAPLKQKRKAGNELDTDDGRKKHRASVSPWLQPVIASAPNCNPALPSTPQRSARLPADTNPPTPAREILSGMEANTVVLRPPTPPRIAERTPRNGYPSLKLPHTPEGDSRAAAAQRFGFGSVARPRPVPQKLNFFTPQPQRRDSTSRPTSGARHLFTPQPRREGVVRPIAGLPPRKLQPVIESNVKPMDIPATVSTTQKSNPPEIHVSNSDDVMDIDTVIGPQPQLAGASTVATPERSASDVEMMDAEIASVAPERSPSKAPVGAAEQDTLVPVGQPQTSLMPAPSPLRSAQTGSTSHVVGADNGTSRDLRRPPTVPSSLPVRRPSTLPSADNEPAQLAKTPGVRSQSSQATAATPSTRRQPSYPSSLGSGPLSRQTPRVVSNPVTRSASNPVHATNSLQVDPAGVRAVSDPPLRSVSASLAVKDLSRRQSFADTSRNLSALNDALAKLRLPGPSTDTVRPKPVRKTFVSSVSTSSSSSTPVSASSRPRNLVSTARPSLASLPVRAVNRSTALAQVLDENDPVKKEKNTGAYNRSFAALMAAQKGGSFLKGVVAYVDVRNEDGDDTGSTFVDMLRNCGAKVVARPTESCTHFVYKSGKPATSAFWRKMPSDRRPHVVGLRWVTRTLEAGQRAPEEEHRVDFGDDELFQKRRRSMEPKMGMGTPCSLPSRPSRASGRSGRMPTIPDGHNYAPRVGSPLKKAHSLR